MDKKTEMWNWLQVTHKLSVIGNLLTSRLGYSQDKIVKFLRSNNSLLNGERPLDLIFANRGEEVIAVLNHIDT